MLMVYVYIFFSALEKLPIYTSVHDHSKIPSSIHDHGSVISRRTTYTIVHDLSKIPSSIHDRGSLISRLWHRTRKGGRGGARKTKKKAPIDIQTE